MESVSPLGDAFAPGVSVLFVVAQSIKVPWMRSSYFFCERLKISWGVLINGCPPSVYLKLGPIQFRNPAFPAIWNQNSKKTLFYLHSHD